MCDDSLADKVRRAHYACLRPVAVRHWYPDSDVKRSEDEAELIAEDNLRRFGTPNPEEEQP